MSKKESYWFSHDSDAASNPRLVALIDKYGFEGYGRWWRLLERLRSCDGYRYDTDTPFAWAVLGKDLMLNATEAQGFVNDCIQYFGILQTDGQYLWSESLVGRMEFWEKKREVLRERGKKGGNASGKTRAKNKSEAQVENNTSEQQISEAQVENNEVQVTNTLSTSGVNPMQNEANDTKLNETKPNETTLYSKRLYPKLHDDDIEDRDLKSDVMENTTQHTGNTQPQQALEILRNRALADDQRFVYAYVSTGRLDKAQLGDWLTAFNTWLQFTGEQIKEERDYRRHFASWFRYHDPKKEDPKLYNPAATKTPVSAPPTAITVPLPVAKSLLQEEEATPEATQDEGDTPQEKRSSFQLKIEPNTRGRYSNGNNKYDMHWLKSLRDEVRSMGG